MLSLSLHSVLEVEHFLFATSFNFDGTLMYLGSAPSGKPETVIVEKVLVSTSYIFEVDWPFAPIAAGSWIYIFPFWESTVMSSLEMVLVVLSGNMSAWRSVVVPDVLTLYKFNGEYPPLLVFVGSLVTIKPKPVSAVDTSFAKDVETRGEQSNVVVKRELKNFFLNFSWQWTFYKKDVLKIEL